MLSSHSSLTPPPPLRQIKTGIVESGLDVVERMNKTVSLFVLVHLKSLSVCESATLAFYPIDQVSTLKQSPGSRIEMILL